MSSHKFDPNGSTKEFTLTAFWALVILFVFMLGMEQCKGPFKPAAPGAATTTAVEK